MPAPLTAPSARVTDRPLLCPRLHVQASFDLDLLSIQNYYRRTGIFLGTLGAHRFYLYGPRDLFGWAHLIGTLIGIPGAMLLVASERTSMLGWVLAFPGAVSLLAAFLAAIVYGLRPDEKWDRQFNAHTQRTSRSGWTVIFVVIFSLLIGAFLLMTGLAISFQTYFEGQVQAAKALSQ